MEPTIGRIVHYKLSQEDAEQINRRRHDAATSMDRIRQNKIGYIAHVGASAGVGDVLPAQIVRCFGGTTVNLQVTLDGNDHYWATSRQEGNQPGQWFWPPRV